MPSHMSTIGFDVQTEEDVLALVQQVAEQTQDIAVKSGHYHRWCGGYGEELWFQTDADGHLVGMNPHFTGKSSLSVGLQERVHREEDTPLDGALYCWADPEQGKPDSGAYPFVFDVPDAATYSDLELPSIATAQIAAFAHEVTCFDSTDEYDASQTDGKIHFASRSFIPSGTFLPDDGAIESPAAMAIITGHVLEAGVRENTITGLQFYWGLVDTLGGRYDVVIDRSLLAQAPAVGGVLSGQFYLTGRLTSYSKKKRTWFGKLPRVTG